MQRIRRGRIGARLCAVLIFAALLAVVGRAGLAGATPSPSGQSPAVIATSATPTPTADAGGGLSLKIGSLAVNLNLPLEIPGLLTVGNGTGSTTPSATPSSSTITSAAPSTSTPARPSRSHTPTHSATPPAQGGFGAPPVTPPRHGHGATHPASPTTTKGHAHNGPAGAIVLSTRLLAGDPILLLASVLASLVLGVAVFVRLSGRRGGHQA